MWTPNSIDFNENVNIQMYCDVKKHFSTATYFQKKKSNISKKNRTEWFSDDADPAAGPLGVVIEMILHAFGHLGLFTKTFLLFIIKFTISEFQIWI